MDGYAKIAHLMGRHTELGIFRRFGALNFQNLLYLQAKLTRLENDLKQLVQRDQAHPDREFYSKDWWSLARTKGNDPNKRQWKKVLQIRKTLREYSMKYLFELCLTNCVRCFRLDLFNQTVLRIA
jgi:hypothetical protein